MDLLTNRKKQYCHNCHYPVADTFCTHCGQKYTTGKTPLWTIIRDLLSNIFNLDAKFFVTLRDLLFPGKLTQEFFKGRHKRYANPVRLFLFATVLFFALFNLQLSKLDLDASTELNNRLHQMAFLSTLDSLKEETARDFDNAEAERALDSLLHRARQGKKKISDTIFLSEFLPFNDTLDYELPSITYKQLLESSPDEIVEKHASRLSFFHRLVIKQGLKAFKDGNSLFNYFLNHLTLVVILMMPFVALILKFLYIRRNKFYIEHLIFLFHYHVVVFFLASILSLFAERLTKDHTITAVVFLLLYLFLAMKRYYGQGKRKTFLKFFILINSYLVLTSIFFIFGLLFSFFLF